MNCTIFLYHSQSPCVLEFTVTSFTPYFVLRDSGNVERFSVGSGPRSDVTVKALFSRPGRVLKGGGVEDQDQGRQT